MIDIIIIFAVIIVIEAFVIAKQAKLLDVLSDKYLDAVTELEVYEPNYVYTESWDRVTDDDLYI